MTGLNFQVIFQILLTLQVICVVKCSVHSREIFKITKPKCPKLLSLLTNGGTICDRVTCESIVKEELCPADTIYVPNFSLCGCCPKCVLFRKLGEACEPNTKKLKWTPDDSCLENNHCPVEVDQCLPGLVCSENEKKCEEPDETVVPDHETEECLFRKSLRRLSPLSDPSLSFLPVNMHHWDPSCRQDGSFSPRQCKGTHYSGECYCVNRGGNRIFGREWRLDSENQTCECSRRTYELREKNLIASLHCTPDGNFEPLQCDTDSGICYCVDPQTGELDGAVLPEKNWKLLPCFNLNMTDGTDDGRYLRKCESQYAAGKSVLITGKQHGIRLELKMPNCDYDGSYAPIQTSGTIHECVFKNGTRIKDYFKPTTTAMNCHCSRDKEWYFPSEEVPNTLDCESGTGNYEIAYDFGSYASCVDEDGFIYGDVAVSKHFCCLKNEGCSTSISQFCYHNETGVEKIKPCIFWRYRN